MKASLIILVAILTVAVMFESTQACITHGGKCKTSGKTGLCCSGMFCEMPNGARSGRCVHKRTLPDEQGAEQPK